MLATYTIEGMTCGHCASAVRTEVSAVPGVAAAAVDFGSATLTVTSEQPVDFDRIVEAVAEAGNYSVA